MQFPYETLRTICKSERVFKKLVSNLLEQLIQTKNLKILFILANKLLVPITKWLYVYAVELDEQKCQTVKNPLVILIELLIEFITNHQVFEQFKNSECQTPSEKSKLFDYLIIRFTDPAIIFQFNILPLIVSGNNFEEHNDQQAKA